MALTREKKRELVAAYKEQIEKATALIFTDYRGATVKQIHSLRTKLREADAIYMVTKNTLLGIALREAGYDMDLDGLLEGPNAIIFTGEDIGKSAKALKEWIKAEGDVVRLKGAILEGAVLDAKAAEALAELPSREQMLATLLSTIMAPATQLVRTINEPAASLVRVIQARVDQGQEAA